VGVAPRKPTLFPNTAEILEWIDQFPDYSGKNKAPDKPEGTSFGELSIIEEFNKSCKRFPMSEVWTRQCRVPTVWLNPVGLGNNPSIVLYIGAK